MISHVKFSVALAGYLGLFLASGMGYDKGPDREDASVRKLVDILAEVPPLPEFSLEFGLGGYFRKDWGPLFLGVQGLGEGGSLWGRNAIEVLVVGQDGVPLAEAAGRLGVSRFAGFSSDLAEYLGYSRVGYVNAFPYGMDGMYSAKGQPADYTTEDGRRVGIKVNVVSNPIWYLGMDSRGPLTPWRNRFYDWMLSQNSGSLRLVLVFGEAARDAFGVYLKSKGVDVPLKFGEAAQLSLSLGQSLLHPAQMGGYNLGGMTFRGKGSLQGLELGARHLENSVCVMYFPHHSYLNRGEGKELAGFYRSLKYQGDRCVEAGWLPPAKGGLAKGESYEYRRAERDKDELSVFFDFGTPKNRYGFVSTAFRRGYAPMSLRLGGSDGAVGLVREEFLKGVRNRDCILSEGRGYSLGRPVGEDRYRWDVGPPLDWGAVLLTADKKVFELNDQGGGLAVDSSVGFFGHYRGDLESPKLICLSDPEGFDDMLTSRALTGVRGQYMEGLFAALGVSPDYLVIKTVPAAMEAMSSGWPEVMEKLSPYLDNVIEKARKEFGDQVVWVGDGKWAVQALTSRGVPFVELPRTENFQDDMQQGWAKLRPEGLPVRDLVISPQPIPRDHLPFFSRFWEGACGDSVLPDIRIDPRRDFLFVLPAQVLDQFAVAESQKWHDRYLKLLGHKGVGNEN